MTDKEAAIILFKKIDDDYNICVCDNIKYMKVNNICMIDEKDIEQKK